MRELVIAGGWGYPNLGDEAILAGYVEWARSASVRVTVISRRPDVTRQAQNPGLVIRSERGHCVDGDLMLLGGGGYLNGSWIPEIDRKLARLRRMRGEVPLVAHAVEVRGFSRRAPGAVTGLLRESQLSVRDEASAQELRALGLPSGEVVPDAISLLYPYLERYGQKVGELSSMVALNLLDVAKRPDRHESLIDFTKYDDLFAEVVEDLGERALGVVVGEGDYKYMRRFGKMRFVEPRSVAALLTVLRSVSGTVSVRMHPALISTQLGKPTVALPYCGKVVGTLGEIGLSSTLLTSAQASECHRLLEVGQNFGDEWRAAYERSSRWLNEHALTGLSCCPSGSASEECR